MSTLNKVQIIGRLGDDPTLRHTTTGKPVGNFSVATSMKTTNPQGTKEEVEWHRVVVWDKQAENCKKYLSKGKLVYVEGRIATRQYEKDGQRHFMAEIIAQNVQFLSSKDEGEEPKHASQYPRNETPQSVKVNEPEVDWSDVPF